MRKFNSALVVCTMMLFRAFGQTAPSAAATAAEQDHQKMMDMLHITTLRPAAGGDNTPHPANYDEAKANVYPNLPNPLVLNNGQKVTTAQVWWDKRRPEIVEDFDREVYGRVPKNVPKVNWEVVSTVREKNGDVDIITKKLIGHVDNSSYPQDTVNIDLTLSVPANATKPVPVVMQFGWVFPAGARRLVATTAVAPATPPGPTWQQQVLAKGWGYAVIIPTTVQPDNGVGVTKGIIPLVNKGQPRKADDWGALRAWAWGASRALDYLETDKAVNAKEVALEGHSRYGKATLVALANDQRFAIGYVSSSGTGGSKLWRHNVGEMLENLTATNEYHWMAPNFLKYGGPMNAGDLPVDSHELIALCAPRPMFFGGGSNGDAWADGMGTFKAIVAAGPVYRLLGKKDLGTETFPPVETPLINGDLAWRQHTAGHTDVPNWPTFIAFAARYFK